MSWTTAEADLRLELSDGPSDKFRFRKKLIGQVDGSNTIFKTLEFRRLTNFAAPSGHEGVFVNNVLAPITADFAATGEVQLTTAPTQMQRVEGTYYIQWFTDIEIQTFLRVSCNWLSLGDDYTVIESGLRPCAIDFAQGEAYEKLALKWTEKISETYLLNDAIDKDRFNLPKLYNDQAVALKKSADGLRTSFYTRAGQNLQPLFSNISGRVQDPSPKR